MRRDDILAQIVQNPRLPTPPSVAMQVLQLINRPSCSLKEISQVIGCDPGLSGRILKLVNSSLYRPAQPIGSLNQALQMLGLRRVRTLALSLALPSLKLRSVPGPHIASHWRGSVAQAVIARELALHLRRPDADTDMIAGLLCDLGTLLLHEAFPDDYRRLLERPLSEPAASAEEEIFGVNHAEVAAAVLSNWGLPADLTEPIRYHHCPAEAPDAHSERCWLLYGAFRISQLGRGEASGELLAEIDALARERFGMGTAEFEAFLASLHARIDEFASFIDVDTGPTENFQQLYSAATENLSRLAAELSIDNLRAHEEKSQAQESLKRAEEALQKQEEHLRHMQKMEAIGRLAGGVAHDFNNLLTVINGYSQMLLTLLPEGEPTHRLARDILGAGERAAGLTRQLLAFSRKQVLKPQVVDVNIVLTEMDSLLRRLAGEHIKLEWQLAGGIRCVKVDRGQLEQVVMNLAVNARDAIPHGGAIRIATEDLLMEQADGNGSMLIPAGQYVRLTLSDTGMGMSAETLQHLFEPFFTTKETGKGTGLGLAVVHGIVKQSGGHIRVSSTLGAGSSFAIYLPGVSERAEATVKLAAAPVPTGTETVMIVEDEDSVRALAQHTLDRCGYKTLVASDGAQALRLGDGYTGPIDLLLTDIVMPVMGGFDLAQQLLQRRPEIKVIYTSGYADIMQLDQGSGRAEMAFLHKPFTPRDLALKVRAALS